MQPIIPPNREWTPAIAAHNEPTFLELEDDYEERFEFVADRHRVVLGLGGIPIEVATESDGIHDFLLSMLGPFAETSEPRVRLALGTTSSFPFKTLIGTMKTYARGRRVIGKFRKMAGFVDTDRGVGRGLIEGDNYRQDVINFLRLVVDAMTPPLSAILFHTAAVARSGRAYLFYGHSTAGKSTITHLAAQRYPIMTDDMLVLRIEDGCVRAATCGFWGGETKQYPTKRLDFPVSGFYRLQKGETNEIGRLDTTRSALDVVCGIPSLTRPMEDHQFILDFATRAAASVPFYQLQFHKRDDSFWSLIDEYER